MWPLIGAIRDCVLRADSGVRVPVLYIGTIRIRHPAVRYRIPVAKDPLRPGVETGRSCAAAGAGADSRAEPNHTSRPGTARHGTPCTASGTFRSTGTGPNDARAITAAGPRGAWRGDRAARQDGRVGPAPRRVGRLARRAVLTPAPPLGRVRSRECCTQAATMRTPSISSVESTYAT
jgi:hypothetical protein